MDMLVTSRRNRYVYLVCPVCGGSHLGVSLKDESLGAYRCWTGLCSSENIKKAWEERYGSNFLEDINAIIKQEMNLRQEYLYTRRFKIVDSAEELANFQRTTGFHPRTNYGEYFLEGKELSIMMRPVGSIKFINNPYTEPTSLETLVTDGCLTFDDYYKRYSVFWHVYSTKFAVKRVVYRRDDGSYTKVIVPMVRESESARYEKGITLLTQFYNDHYLNSQFGVSLGKVQRPNAFIVAEGEKVCDWLLYNWQIVGITFPANLFAKIFSHPTLGIEAVCSIIPKTKGIKNVLYIMDNDITGFFKAIVVKILFDHLGYHTWIVHPAIQKANWQMLGHYDLIMDTHAMTPKAATYHSERVLEYIRESMPEHWDIADNPEYSLSLFMRRILGIKHVLPEFTRVGVCNA